MQAGDSAPSFSITADNGQTFSPTSFGGKLLVLNFWATWCPPCVSETPSLSEFQRQLTDSGVVVLAVSVDKSEKAYRDFLAKMKPAFVTARDPDAEHQLRLRHLQVSRDLRHSSMAKSSRSI